MAKPPISKCCAYPKVFLHSLNPVAQKSRTFTRYLRPLSIIRNSANPTLVTSSILTTPVIAADRFCNSFLHRRRIMGSMASCSRPTEVVSPKAIRVVHLNGRLDEFPAPVSVKRALQNDPRHFICRSRDISAVNCRALQPGENLQLGELYFLLPLSVLESDLSAENLVALAARLYAAARKGVSRAAQRRRSGDSICDLPGEGHSSLMRNCEDPEVKMAVREHLISRSRSWRPCLHTIHETGLAC